MDVERKRERKTNQKDHFYINSWLKIKTLYVFIEIIQITVDGRKKCLVIKLIVEFIFIFFFQESLVQ